MKSRFKFLIFPGVFLLSALSASALYQTERGSLHVLADFGITYEDNVFLTSSDQTADWHFEFAPGIEYTATGALSSTTLRYQHRWLMYDDRDDLDSSFAEFDFNTTYDSGVLLINVHAGYNETYSSRYSVIDGIPDLFGELVQYDTTEFSIIAKKEISELTAFDIGFEYFETEYKGEEFTSTKSYSIPVNYYYQIRPKVDMVAGVRYRKSKPTEKAFEYDDWWAYIGAVGELFSPNVYADLRVGYQRRNAKNSNADSKSPSYDLTLTYTGSVKSTYYLSLRRDYRTSAIQGDSYAATSLQLGGSYAMTDRVGFNGSIGWAETDYEEGARAEDIFMFDLGASYSPNEYLMMRATYSYRDVQRSGSGFGDYDSNEFRLLASLRY